MNLDELKEELRNTSSITGIPCKHFGIGAGGAMMFHGLRDYATDVDVSVPSALFENLRSKFPVETFHSCMNDSMAEKISIGNVDIHNDADTADILDRKHIMMDGFKVESIYTILKHKKLMGRPKDQTDIKVLLKSLIRG